MEAEGRRRGGEAGILRRVGDGSGSSETWNEQVGAKGEEGERGISFIKWEQEREGAASSSEARGGWRVDGEGMG